MTTEPTPARIDWPALNVQVVRPTCPFCSRPVASLLAGCGRDDCRRLENAEDHTFARSQDL